MLDVVQIADTQKTLAESQIVNRIEQIGFTRSIIAYKTIDSGGELKIGALDACEIKYMQIL